MDESSLTSKLTFDSLVIFQHFLSTHGVPNDKPSLRVGLIGCGAMGRGIAFQVDATDGLNLAWACDQNLGVAEAAASHANEALHSDTLLRMLSEHPIDVLVEATNSVGPAAEHCLAAFDHNSHVVLMNAEVDLALGPLLHHRAAKPV